MRGSDLLRATNTYVLIIPSNGGTLDAGITLCFTKPLFWAIFSTTCRTIWQWICKLKVICNLLFVWKGVWCTWIQLRVNYDVFKKHNLLGIKGIYLQMLNFCFDDMNDALLISHPNIAESYLWSYYEPSMVEKEVFGITLDTAEEMLCKKWLDCHGTKNKFISWMLSLKFGHQFWHWIIWPNIIFAIYQEQTGQSPRNEKQKYWKNAMRQIWPFILP